jgi:hypothetical protein
MSLNFKLARHQQSGIPVAFLQSNRASSWRRARASCRSRSMRDCSSRRSRSRSVVSCRATAPAGVEFSEDGCVVLLFGTDFKAADIRRSFHAEGQFLPRHGVWQLVKAIVEQASSLSNSGLRTGQRVPFRFLHRQFCYLEVRCECRIFCETPRKLVGPRRGPLHWLPRVIEDESLGAS